MASFFAKASPIILLNWTKPVQSSPIISKDFFLFKVTNYLKIPIDTEKNKTKRRIKREIIEEGAFRFCLYVLSLLILCSCIYQTYDECNLSRKSRGKDKDCNFPVTLTFVPLQSEQNNEEFSKNFTKLLDIYHA